MSFSWGSGVSPARSPHVRCRADRSRAEEHQHRAEGTGGCVRRPGFSAFLLPVPPITVGQLTKMVVLRKAIADGAAPPRRHRGVRGDLESAQEGLEDAMVIAAEALIAARGDKLLRPGLWTLPVSGGQAVRERGYSAKDFHPDNCIYMAAGSSEPCCRPTTGTRSSMRPSHLRPIGIFRTTACRSSIPACLAVRKAHATTCRRGMVPFVLDKEGDALLPQARARSRAAPPSSTSRSTDAGTV